MRKLLLSIVLLAATLTATAQQWSDEEMAAANTSKDVEQLTLEEREVIKYLNLARLYPRKFADLEVANYYGGEKHGNPSMFSDNRLTLMAELYAMKPCGALVYEPALIAEARCLADEQSKNGEIGHQRHNCAKTHGGECCGYGYSRGSEIVVGLLIDDGVEGLGHRAICLDAGYGSVAVAIDNHPVFEYGAVLDFAWGDESASTTLRYLTLQDLDAGLQQQLYEKMTQGIAAEIKKIRPSGSTVTNVQTEMHRSSGRDGVKSVKTETRYHADGTKHIIETTTVMSLDGIPMSKTIETRIE